MRAQSMATLAICTTHCREENVPEARSAFMCRPKTKCPCSYGESNCFSIGHCSTLVPSSLALKVVHFIRNPLDIITSAFLYHSQLVRRGN